MQWEGVSAGKQGMKLLADPQSLNFYSYTRDNPVNLTDPSGKIWYNPASWNVNWKSIGTGSFLVVAGVAEIAVSCTLEGATLGGGTPLAGLGVSAGFASFGVGLADVVNGVAGSENEPLGLDFTTGITPTLGTNQLQELVDGLNEKLDAIEPNNNSKNNPMNFDNTSTYRVQKGDTLSSVFGDNWKIVAEYNNLNDPNQIQTGQELKVPDSVKEKSIN